jgi:hypothetical protein
LWVVGGFELEDFGLLKAFYFWYLCLPAGCLYRLWAPWVK